MPKTVVTRFDKHKGPPGGISREAAQDVIKRLTGKYPGALLGKPEPAVTVSTGSLALDLMLGGGYAKGRIVELFGPEGSGKTTVTLAAVTAFQEQDLSATYVDMENALHPPYMEACGVDLSRLTIWQPDSAEAALSIAEEMCEVMDLVVLDSLAMLVPRAELEGEIGDSHVGLLPRLLGQFTRKLAPVARKHGTVVLLINQLRMKVGVMYGNPETTPGGRAVPYAASTRLDVRRSAELDVKEQVDGEPRLTSVGAKITARKHKTGAPFGIAQVPIRLGFGVDHARELALLGRTSGVFAMTGNSARFEGELVGIGKDAVIERLRADRPLGLRLDAAIRAQYAQSGQRERAVAALEEDDETVAERSASA